MVRNQTLVLSALALTIAATWSWTAIAKPGPTQAKEAVFTISNDPVGNAVIAYDREPDGTLTDPYSYPTGGLGSGSGLGSQGAIVLSENSRWLLAVNPGSDEVSLFRVHPAKGLQLRDVVPSGGVRPISVAIHGKLVYVLNAGGASGGADNIVGFSLEKGDKLVQLPGSSRPLSAASTGPSQIGFSPDGKFLVVAEKATNSIDTYSVDKSGYATGPLVNVSAGMTPFAFDFTRSHLLLVSEVFGGAPDAGAVSVYRLMKNGTLSVVDPSSPNGETAPCWLVATPGGRYCYTTNTPDDSLTGYAIEADGTLTLLDADGKTGQPGAGTGPLDMDLSRDGRFLYTLNSGNDTIGAFRVMPDGSLFQLPSTASVPGTALGLAAR